MKELRVNIAEFDCNLGGDTADKVITESLSHLQGRPRGRRARLACPRSLSISESRSWAGSSGS